MRHNIVVGLAIFFAWAFMVSLMVAGLLMQQLSTTGFSTTGGNIQGNSTNQQGSVVLTLEEIALHNDQNDCWIIVNNNVYDVTSYLQAHPGGADAILPYCGSDGTQGFATQDKPKPSQHSSTAASLLSQYYIGAVGQAQQNTISPTQPPATTNGGDDDRDDDKHDDEDDD